MSGVQDSPAPKSDGLLEKIKSPADLKALSVPQLTVLAEEIRRELVDVVSVKGGHLAPSLGAVELTLALHRVFNAPADKIVWDVGHQAYVHKLVTGRQELFKNLRSFGGCCGFLSMRESEYDCFGAGHAGTAISAALGMAAARDRRGGNEKVVAVVGDGSLNCGISLEGLNNVSEITKDFIIVLNDNKMSISRNVGAIPRYLNQLISGRRYNRFKALAKMMLKKMPGGEEIRGAISKVEEATKSLFVPGVFFEELGFRYLGPIPGHNFGDLFMALEAAKDYPKPVLIHVITEKGRGYSHAAAQPEKFHGLSPFNPETGECPTVSENGKITFSKAFGLTMSELAEKDDGKLAVITAAMKSGAGLSAFAENYPDKIYDCGIAEEHAVVFAAGLAAAGMRPVLSMYATFLQRALDCVFHDVCLQNLPVIFCADRAGVVEDGPTHHGIHDLCFLRNMPNLSILAPKDENELRGMIWEAWRNSRAAVIRYPRGSSGQLYKGSLPPQLVPWGAAELVREGDALAIWAAGKELWTALETADILEKKHGVKCSVVNARFLKPFDRELFVSLAEKMPVVTIEDCQISGGLGSIADEILSGLPFSHGTLHFGWDDSVIPFGEPDKIRLSYGLTPLQMAEKIALRFGGRKV
jgi:1-deoxy-D-xylulose-5-phosphate synthase